MIHFVSYEDFGTSWGKKRKAFGNFMFLQVELISNCILFSHRPTEFVILYRTAPLDLGQVVGKLGICFTRLREFCLFV